MKKKTNRKLSKKQKFSLGGIVALVVILAGGGYYLSNQETEKSDLSKEEQEIQQNLQAKEEQIEKNSQTENTPANTTSPNPAPATTPQVTLTSLSSASITGMKDGSMVYLSVYGVGSGKYEVEKNGIVVLPATDYSGHGGLTLPNQTDLSANYKVFLITDGKRVASSKIITVNTNFVGTKEFTGV